MTHNFESIERPFFTRFKEDTLLEALSTKTSSLCQATLKPAHFPKPPKPASRDMRPYVFPAHSRWFDFKKIHKIEYIEFPELVDPEFAKEYMKIRNKCVKLFRLFPTSELTVSSVRHVHGGNYTLIKRIHNFLAIWGLINFQNYTQNESDLTKADTALLRDDFCTILDPKSTTTPAPSQYPAPHTMHCTICDTICQDGHFLSVKYPGVVLCPRCFTHHYTLNQIGAQHAAFEYRSITVPRPNAAIKGDQEKKLVESFSRNFTDNDWMRIADDVSRHIAPTNPMMPQYPQPPQFSALDCLVHMTRIRAGDANAPETIMDHEFCRPDPLTELAALAPVSDAPGEVEFPAHVDWDALDADISTLAAEVREACK